MAEKKTTKKTEVGKTKRVREISIITVIIIYVISIASVGISAYAYTEKGFVENRLSKMAKKFANNIVKEEKSIPFINAALEDNVCENTNGSFKCKKNISDSKTIKGYTFLVTESYTKDGDSKKNILSTITVNGTLYTAENGYEIDTVEGKKIGNNTYAIVNLVNNDGDVYSVVFDQYGRTVIK